MAKVKCGFNNVVGGVSGRDQLTHWGPTLLVDIGFDPNFKATVPPTIPAPGRKNIDALVDCGAKESCIDSVLAAQLNLPIIDRRHVAGSGGKHEVNYHLAQIHVPSLNFTIYGQFAGVHLQSGGQRHLALIGRTFLQYFTMTYEGRSGNVIISSD
jgi:hypothetical protein